MSLNSILGSAVGALQVNQTALKVTSGNITNLNTEGYHRRVVQQGPGLTGSTLTGVTIEQVRRITDAYLGREAVLTAGASGAVNVETGFRDRIQSILGSLEGGASLINRISDITSALSQLAVEPASSARRASTVSDIQTALGAITGMANQIQALRQNADTELASQIGKTNQLLTQFANLNSDIKLAVALGDTSTGLLDQRDRVLAELSSMMDLQTYEQPDGRMFLNLMDGTQLVGDLRAQLSYIAPISVSSGTVFPSIQLQRVNPETDAPVGPVTTLEGRLQGGTMRGLLDMRDRALPDLAEQIGAVAGSLTEGLNAIHSGASAVPAPGTLTGSNTGLLSTDALNFSGRTSLAVTDATGVLVKRIDIDFTAGTLSVNGGGAVAIGATVGSLTTALNAALGGDGTATFTNGAMSLSASASGNGLSFVQDATNPSSRAGRGFAQVFGLNDLVRASVPPTGNTGLAAGNAHGFTPGGVMGFSLRAPTGQILLQGSYTVGGSSVADLVTGLNTAANGVATFSLDANGALVMSSPSGARLEITNDTSARGATGVSISQMFGLGTKALADRAQGLTIRSDIAANPSKLAAAKLDLSPTTLPGAIVLGKSDNRAAQAMAAMMDTRRDWSAAGGLSANQMSVTEYVSQITATQAQLAQSASSESEYRSDVAQEVKARKDKIEGVNLDEELAQMILYQQAYNAAARIMTTVQDMYDILLSTKR